MQYLSNRIVNLPESQTIAMSQKSREMVNQGIDVINLSLGEPDFDVPTFIKDAAKKAIDDNFSHYTPVPGYLDVRQTIADKLKRDNDLDYNAAQIVLSTGAKQSLINIVLSLVNPGEDVILPAPYWVSYKAMVELAEGNAIVVPSTVENDYKIDAKELRSYINRKTKLIIFSSPCNPSGSVYTKEELREIADVVKAKEDLFIVSDEIYELINFTSKHESLAQFDDIKDQVITVNGLSKGFAMTGWRLGYIAAPLWIAKAVSKMQGQYTSGPNSIAQKAGQAALEASPEEVSYMKDAFLERRDLVLELCNSIEGFKNHIPQGAFYLFPDVSEIYGRSFNGKEINNSNDLCMYLLEEAKVATVPGSAFGSPQCIRLSYATDKTQLIEAMSRIKKAIENLK